MDTVFIELYFQTNYDLTGGFVYGVIDMSLLVTPSLWTSEVSICNNTLQAPRGSL